MICEDLALEIIVCMYIYTYQERMSAKGAKEHVTPFYQNPNSLRISIC